ncbi:MAG: hypothetical protein IJV65_09485 [Kiritimatiellae bacterium]|nr:hypothetical protein [Kiritimatiellia bacterium]
MNGTSRHVLGYLQDFLFAPDRARTPVKALADGTAYARDARRAAADAARLPAARAELESLLERWMALSELS